MLTLPDTLIADSCEQLRTCGDGRRECVVYWCAGLDEPDVLTRVVHPVHTAAGGGYQVDDGWVMEFFKTLHRTRETVRVQLHTHPRAAGHSWIDDAYALVPAEGFFSLVIPDTRSAQ